LQTSILRLKCINSTFDQVVCRVEHVVLGDVELWVVFGVVALVVILEVDTSNVPAQPFEDVFDVICWAVIFDAEI